MSGIRLYEEFKDEVDEEIKKLATKLVNGNCKTFEDYKAMCAEIKGLKRSKESFKKVVNRYHDIEGETHE